MCIRDRTYTDSYQVTAGAEAGSAGKVDRDDLTASVFQNPYVQITPVTTIPVEQVILDQSTLSLTTGGTAALQASVLPADATEPRVTWTSSDQTVAVVDQAGLVTAVGPGTVSYTHLIPRFISSKHNPDSVSYKHPSLVPILSNTCLLYTSGYRNLSALVSRSFTEGFYGKPRVDWELLTRCLLYTSRCV